MKKTALAKSIKSTMAVLLAAAVGISGCGMGAGTQSGTAEQAMGTEITQMSGAEETGSAHGSGAEAAETTETAAADRQEAQETAAREVDDSLRWNLEDIYPSEEAFRKDIEKVKMEYIPGIDRFRGKLNTADQIKECFDYKEEAQQVLTFLLAYVNLRTSENQMDSQATEDFGEVQNVYNDYLDASKYISTEIYENDEAFLNQLIASEDMAPHRNQLQREWEQSEHLLPEAEEKLLTPLNSIVNGASMLFSKLTNADMEFPTVTDAQGNEHEVNESAWRNAVYSSPDREYRENITRALFGTYGKYRNTLAQNMDNFVQGNVNLAHMHGYGSDREASLTGNTVPISVFDKLMEAAGSHLNLRYDAISMRKTALGYDTLHNGDTYIPITEDVDQTFSYEEAKALLKEALKPLGDTYCSDFALALDSRWVDVYPAEGKASGASSTGVPGSHSFVCLNYQDDFDSVSTLGHEMGHAMHQYYSGMTQESDYNRNPIIFTSEVASTANELLLSDYMISNAKSDKEKLFYLSAQLTLLDSTFFNQTMYAEFEDRMYQAAEEGGTLTPDLLENLWTENYGKYYGSDLEQIEENRYNWSRIPHFYYNYYVFQYATSIGASCNIVDRILSGEDGAVDGYLEFLRAGDSTDAVSTLKIAGVDMTSAGAYDSFFARYEKVLSQMEELL